jgi:tricarballylate dehydrogenase
MGRLTQYRCDPDMTEILIRSSFDAGVWMRSKGVRFQLGLGRQAFRVDGKFKFWGGLACHIWGGGKELMKALHTRAARDGISVLYETPAIGLLQGDRGVEGVRVRHRGRLHELRAKAVVLACGGFEANAEMRARYLGPNWDLAKVRGTRFNTGQGLFADSCVEGARSDASRHPSRCSCCRREYYPGAAPSGQRGRSR